MDKQEILNAVRIIKETCEAQHFCQECPFGDYMENCVIQNVQPCDWFLNDGDTLWRAIHG